MRPFRPLLVFAVFLHSYAVLAQTDSFRVVGYYAGRTIPPDSFEVEKLTHLIWCFGHLKQDHLHIHNAVDSAIIQQMVRLKKRNPQLNVMLSLGGWGGCASCSDVFSSHASRVAFANSVKKYCVDFGVDGIDLDWEYPVVPGYPGHTYSEDDRSHFSALIHELRSTLGDDAQISFAAGGFTDYIARAIDWPAVCADVNFINIMSYDLVHGFSATSGHHTPLYSTPQQQESTDHAVQLLLEKGIPPQQLVIGAACYGRFFEMTSDSIGLYQPCKFVRGFSHKDIETVLAPTSGFTTYWDDIACAPYAIHAEKKWLATYDDKRSIALKTRYAVKNKLGGIMFWQLYDDSFHEGLLDVIDQNK